MSHVVSIMNKTEKALSITWQKNRVPGSYVDLPGVYCLRSNQTQWPEEQLWRT